MTLFGADAATLLRGEGALGGAVSVLQPDDPLPSPGPTPPEIRSTPHDARHLRQHPDLLTAVVTAVDRPVLLDYAPARPTDTAMLVLGGGGYTQLMVGREGVQVARWLTGLGLHAAVLVHRFPDARTGPDAPVDDARRAMAMLRARFARVGVVGLSSGGHLAACLLSEGMAEARPDAAVIGYAPISTNAAGRTVVADKPPLAPPEKQALYDRHQPDVQMAAAPPPLFIAYAANDPVVPVANAYRLHEAAVARGGSAELHVFADAPHGFALDTQEGPVTLWPKLCAAWLRQTGLLPAA